MQILESQGPPCNLEELSLKDQHPGYGAFGLFVLRQMESASWACCPLPCQDTIVGMSRDCCGLNKSSSRTVGSDLWKLGPQLVTAVWRGLGGVALLEEGCHLGRL